MAHPTGAAALVQGLGVSGDDLSIAAKDLMALRAASLRNDSVPVT